MRLTGTRAEVLDTVWHIRSNTDTSVSREGAVTPPLTLVRYTATGFSGLVFRRAV